jgi:C4-dicarboxylate-specific signal transduction histidine kinase
MGGALIVAPLLILWCGLSIVDWKPQDLLERLGALCALITLSVVVYGGGLPISRGNYPLQVLVLPPLIWTAVRLGQLETAIAVLTLTIVATYGTASGYGPFAPVPRVESMLLLRSFLIILSMTVLTLAATISQQRQARTALAESEHNVRRLLEQAELREQALRLKQQQLIQSAKLASIGELATGVAHELNNPLNNINLYLYNALDHLHDGRPGAIVVEDLRAAMQQVQRGAAIINGLQTFGRAASTEHEPLSINSVVRSALQLIAEPLRLGNIEVILDLSTSNPTVLGNRIQLEQVFLNLLSNAKDAVNVLPDGRIRVATWADGVSTHVAFEDNGTGIAPEVLPKIFDPFFTTKVVGQGTGLGLSIVYSIVREHRGNILAENLPERGARFLVQLPM